MAELSETAAVLALTETATALGVPWYEVADVVELAGGALGLATGERMAGAGAELVAGEREAGIAARLAAETTPEMVAAWGDGLGQLLSDGSTSVVTVLDQHYPVNLRRVYNRPPFLFVRGTLSSLDERSVAVVGSRRASLAGRHQAAELAADLSRAGVTVVSGLAAGIDTAAHTAALEAGGRTLAVMGTGIDRVYPAQNAALAERIPGRGALVSQFWPGAAPAKENFPLRNVVSSGMAMGTVVVEAPATSGAKMQARLALEHGKRLFLVESLVAREDWARRYAERPGATVVATADDVVAALDADLEAERAAQLSFF